MEASLDNKLLALYAWNDKVNKKEFIKQYLTNHLGKKSSSTRKLIDFI